MTQLVHYGVLLLPPSELGYSHLPVGSEKTSEVMIDYSHHMILPMKLIAKQKHKLEANASEYQHVVFQLQNDLKYSK
jgi:hypothetical protein